MSAMSAVTVSESTVSEAAISEATISKSDCTVSVMRGVIKLVNVAFQVVQVGFQAVHQAKNVIRITVVMAVEAQVRLLEHLLQVVEQPIGLLEVVAQVMHVARVMRDRMDMSRNSVKLNRV